MIPRNSLDPIWKRYGCYLCFPYLQIQVVLSKNQMCRKNTFQHPKGVILKALGHADAKPEPAPSPWHFSGK